MMVSKAAMALDDEKMFVVAGGSSSLTSDNKKKKITSFSGDNTGSEGTTKEYDCEVCGFKHPFTIVSGNRAIGVGCNTQIEV